MPAKWAAAEGNPLVWELSNSAYEKALHASRRRLFEFADRPQVREAIFLSNPGLYEHIESYVQSLLSEQRSRKHRRREGSLYRYLQRFCAKNDTTSFFGATSLGRFDSVRQSDVLNLPVADVRRVHLEHWLLGLGRFAVEPLAIRHPRLLCRQELRPCRVSHLEARAAPCLRYLVEDKR